uniref:PDZ domain-containing protein n=1 Tax=Mastacembelus armatus TaxID=205130 RepID=A0A3Q3KWS3_9TELE
ITVLPFPLRHNQLLEVDGSNLRGVTHQQAVECLKRTGEPTVILEHRPDSSCPPFVHSPSHTQPPRTEVSTETTLSRAKDYSFVTDENTHEVVLKKSLSGLGFSFYITQLHLGPDQGSVVRIKRLFPGQPALESGQLREGDVILSVNKEPVKNLSYQRVLFLLRGAPSEVHLLICRPGPGVLYDVDDNTLVSSHAHKFPHRRKICPTQQRKTQNFLHLQHSQRARRVSRVKHKPVRVLHLLLAHPPHQHHLHLLHHQSPRLHPLHQHHLPLLPHLHLALHKLHQSHKQGLENQRTNRK